MLPKLNSDSENRPRFEYYPPGSSKLRTVMVEQTPFIIGRGENSGLEINSTSVSREHAQLERTAGGYLLRDLGSTNGTWINGARITEQTLHDGDAVRIADICLTFVCSSLGRLQSMVTQPLAAGPAPADTASTPARVAAARTLSESLLRVSLPLRREEVHELPFRDLVAVKVGVDQPHAGLLESVDSPDPGSVAARFQDVAWLLAAQQSAGRAPGACTLLKLERRGRLNGQCVAAFQQAQLSLPGPGALGVSVPWEWVNDSPQALRTCESLRSVGARLSLENFSGGARCVESLAPATPDFLTLAPEVVRDIATNQRRAQRLEIVQAACEEAGVRLVLPGEASAEDSQAAQELGVTCGVAGSLEARESAFASEQALL
ncbi:ABC transporter ATP-binding/permease protein [Posidoniimonas corsicana]|uniref:ABC transporter ATP-binding/permease protein n=1 Tax=Posidoniimonas corsicana TaxID=1938618 RepID=A0A5C5VGN9_9BACT|nr:FHA domain-containing protein [Posidoniimonas corsicana]TWT37117.1 ABC transporter ATP-binding/permease protein [Posidoniimonas corsicana]